MCAQFTHEHMHKAALCNMRNTTREQLASCLKANLPLHPTSFRNTTKLVRFEETAGKRRAAAQEDHAALPAPEGVSRPASPPTDGYALGENDDMELDYLAAAIAHPMTVAPASASTPTTGPTLYSPAHRTFKVTFRHTEVMEAMFQVTVSDAYPEVLPCWKLTGVTSLGKSTTATTRKSASLPRAQLATAAAELATEVCLGREALQEQVSHKLCQVNVRVPQRVPAEKRGHVLSFQMVALVRALDVYKALWFGDEATRERVPTRGPDRHPTFSTALL